MRVPESRLARPCSRRQQKPRKNAGALLLAAVAMLAGCSTTLSSPESSVTPAAASIQRAPVQPLATVIEVDRENGFAIARLSALQENLQPGEYLVLDQSLHPTATVRYPGIRHGNRIGLMITSGSPNPGQSLVNAPPSVDQ